MIGVVLRLARSGLLLLTLAACASEGRDLDAGARPDAGPRPDAGAELDGGGLPDAAPPDAGPAFEATSLGVVVDDAGVRSERFRLRRGEGAAGYAQWYPPATDGGTGPVLVLAQPYAGIDWTGEAVDERWAARGPGAFPDEDGPDFDSALSSNIGYDPLTIDEAGDQAFVWGFHGIGVLLLFGRFYAGGDVANDIEDMTLGFDFLATRDDVDPSRVGIMGGSWGGFEALYGAAYAREDLRPTVGVALYPVSDFEAERRFATQVLAGRYTQPSSREASVTFFEPYLRRIDATVARNGGFAGLRAEDIASRITGDFLVVHEDWDTLVSFEQSTRLVELAPDRFEPLWLLHEGPPEPWDQALNTHGLLLGGPAGGGIYPFVWAHLLTHLGGAGQDLLVPWDPASFRALLELMRARQAEGKDLGFLAPRLAMLCDPRVSTFDLGAQVTAPGPETLAAELNAVWGSNFDGPAACDLVAQDMLPIP